MNRHVTLFHSPRSRSGSVRALLEELGADYELHVLDMAKGEQRAADYLAVNPMGKVPAIRHGEAIVTEQPAIFLYLADLYPEAELAPPIGDPLRGPYLRWTVFYGSCFEPAVIDRSMQREPGQRSSSPYGDYDTMLSALTQQLDKGPYLLGERFSAADLLWASALSWTTAFKLVPDLPALGAYMQRVSARPAVKRAAQLDAALAESMTARAPS
jgi:glutathione S-transferase